MLNQFHEIDGSNQGGNRQSPNRMSRGRFSPDNGGIRGTLAGVLVGGRASRQSPYGGSRATFSRAGGGSRAGSVRDYDPNSRAADMGNINMHSPDTIDRERHFAKVKQQLHDQFRDIDKNKDGLITKAELLDYLMTLTQN